MAEAEYPNDFYALLGVERDADIAAIRGAFRRVSLEEHPDKAGNTPEAHARYVRITEAYDILSNRTTRRAYDGQAGFDWPVPDIVFDNLFEGRAAFREQVENFKKQRNNLFAKEPTQAELPTELVYADIYHQIDEHLASVRAVSQSLGIIRDQVTGIIPLTNHELWTAMGTAIERTELLRAKLEILKHDILASRRYDSGSFEECFRILDVVKSAFELVNTSRQLVTNATELGTSIGRPVPRAQITRHVRRLLQELRKWP